MDNILQYDEQHGRELGWHGKTIINERLKLSDADFYLRRWNQETCKLTVAVDGGENDGAEIIAPDAAAWKAAFVLSDSGNPEISLGNAVPVSMPFDSSYTLLDNRRMLELISASLSECGLPDDVASVLSVNNRRRTAVSIPLPEMKEFEIGHRKFNAFLNFQNSTDGSTRFLANVSNICCVCQNTMNFNLGIGGFLIKHTKNMNGKLDMLPQVLAFALESQKEFANDFLKMSSEAIEEEKAEAWFVAFIAGQDADNYSVNAQNRVTRLMELFRSGKGNHGKTVADAVSACTDFFSHEAASGKGDDSAKWKNFVSSEFGNGAAMKSNFYAIARDSKKRNAMIAKGRSVRKLAVAA